MYKVMGRTPSTDWVEVKRFKTRYEALKFGREIVNEDSSVEVMIEEDEE